MMVALTYSIDLIESKRKPENKDLEEMKKELAAREAKIKQREEELANMEAVERLEDNGKKGDEEPDEAVFYF